MSIAPELEEYMSKRDERLRRERKRQARKDLGACLLGLLVLLLVIGNAVAYYTAPCDALRHMPVRSAPLRCVMEGK